MAINNRILAALLFMFASSITTQAQQRFVCGSGDSQIQRSMKTNPDIISQLQSFNKEAFKNAMYNRGTRGSIRIIPVVFHVLHQYGRENISKDQILDQMRILNEDFRRKNADKTKTRSIFAGVAADCEVEFRLATIDPAGKCTDGINRINTPFTNNADQVDQPFKAVSYWDSKKYLNIWVVKSIADDGSGLGTVLGYAQLPYPGWGAVSTDGVTVRADYIGTIGTAAIGNSKGRVLTHEIGHWLGEFHTFQGGCNGTSQVNEKCDDTPPVSTATNGCPSSRNSCTNDFPDLPDQTENYMDYADGQCQNMFTADQKAIMDYVFTQYRSKLISIANQKATGVYDTTNKQLCTPMADFICDFNNVCQGASLTFKDLSWHGTPSTYEWTFDHGTPATSNLQNPTIVYNTPGLFFVSLKASNATGSNTVTRNYYVNVIAAVSSIKIPFTEGVEASGFPYAGWWQTNGSTKWERTTSTSYAGSASLYINNYDNTEIDTISFVTSSFDLLSVTQPTLEFYLSNTQRSSNSTDRLRVRVSTDCGMSWTSLYNKSGVALANKGIQNSFYKPSSSSDWRRVILKLTGLGNVHNAMLKFEFVSSGEGNNIYIDNINIGNFTNGISDAQVANSFNLSVFPNPTSSAFTASFELQKAGNMSLKMFDMAGKEINLNIAGAYAAGTHTLNIPVTNLTQGIYFLRLQTADGVASQKLVVE